MSALSTKAITGNAKDISLTATRAGQRNNFCEIWPNAKMALEVLQQIIKNPVAKAAVGIVISAGDAVASRICG